MAETFFENLLPLNDQVLKVLSQMQITTSVVCQEIQANTINTTLLIYTGRVKYDVKNYTDINLPSYLFMTFLQSTRIYYIIK